MGDIRAGLEDLKLEGALFANVKYYVSGEGDPKVRQSFPAFLSDGSNKCEIRSDCTMFPTIIMILSLFYPEIDNILTVNGGYNMRRTYKLTQRIVFSFSPN